MRKLNSLRRSVVLTSLVKCTFLVKVKFIASSLKDECKSRALIAQTNANIYKKILCHRVRVVNIYLMFKKHKAIERQLLSFAPLTQGSKDRQNIQYNGYTQIPNCK